MEYLISSLKMRGRFRSSCPVRALQRFMQAFSKHRATSRALTGIPRFMRIPFKSFGVESIIAVRLHRYLDGRLGTYPHFKPRPKHKTKEDGDRRICLGFRPFAKWSRALSKIGVQVRCMPGDRIMANSQVLDSAPGFVIRLITVRNIPVS
jgi:hypothetical protein